MKSQQEPSNHHLLGLILKDFPHPQVKSSNPASQIQVGPAELGPETTEVRLIIVMEAKESEIPLIGEPLHGWWGNQFRNQPYFHFAFLKKPLQYTIFLQNYMEKNPDKIKAVFIFSWFLIF